MPRRCCCHNSRACPSPSQPFAMRTRRGWASIANRYGITARYRDAEAMLAHAGLDAAGMAVGPGVHARIGAMAMERGLAVFMEKPPAATAKEAQVLADVSARTGKPCVVGLHEALLHREPHRWQYPGSAPGIWTARQPAGRIHDGARLFRRQPRLYRVPAAPLRACDGFGALADGRARAERHRAALRNGAGQAVATCRLWLCLRRAWQRLCWARTSRAARQWSGGR